MNLNASITKVKRVGDKTAQTFEKLNIYTLEDVLFHFPRNYFRYPEAVTVEEITSLQESRQQHYLDMAEYRDEKGWTNSDEYYKAAINEEKNK